MKNEIYLEYEQDEEPIGSLDLDPDMVDGEEDMSINVSEVTFCPTAFYRNPIDGGMKFEVDFDTTGLNFLHVVVVHMIDEDDNYKWHMPYICKTRREARARAFAVEYESSSEFAKDDDKIIGVDTAFVLLED